MKTNKAFLTLVLLLSLLVVAGCGRSTPSPANSPGATNSPQSTYGKTPGTLPENGFKAEIVLVSAPAKLRAGQKETIQLKVKNASDVVWYARGAEVNTNPDNKYYLAAGNRWLDAKDEKLLTAMDGRYGLTRDLKPGEEAEVPLMITAPTEPGDYFLEIDLLQEQVAWFHDKGSPMARAKITVVK